MDHYDVKRLALVLAIQAEIEGMKISDIINKNSPGLLNNEGDYQQKAEKLRYLAYCHNEQL